MTTEARALEAAYAYLNRRERTEAELRAHLERREFKHEEIEAALSELLEFGYLDDARYARVFTQDKRALEQWGAERIRRSLRERGVARELIEQALSAKRAECVERVERADGGGEEAGETELERALALLRRRFPHPPADRRERERALGMLIRKGYESELALDALAAYARE